VVRNRIRRRLREAVRHHLARLAPEWEIVFNPRKTLLDAPFDAILRDVEKLFTRCGTR
jgi:ribonuclease P protein component